ncbi:hypothetical protein KAX17_00550 [Candidatus Bipolaricaulota bacterium]|nr:hypothetical protein [Candidatus Bipolaricaulota bacterium]
MTTQQDRTLNEYEVRLFPSVHITTDREAELRATASLLAIIRAVSEFGRRIVRLSGGPVGRLSCFTEVRYQLDCGGGNPPEELRPDGLVQAVRGKTRWVALVEVKVGRTNLDPEQIDKYHRLAKEERADALITVSNQPALPDGRPPVSLDGRRLRSIPVSHFSWERLLSEAQMLSRKKEVSDPDQKWMLDEWIRYVDDPESRIIVPPDLGSHWGEILKAARTGALDQSSGELLDVARFWMGYLRKAALRLRAKLGVDVEIRLSRKEKSDNQLHLERLVADARANGTLSGVLRIPDAAGDIHIEVFLHSRSVRYALEVAAPTEGRQTTRLNWLSRQLRGLSLPSDMLVTAEWTARGLLTSAPASQFVDNPGTLLVDLKRASLPKDVNPKRFLVQWTTRLQVGRGRSSAPVLEGISKGLEDFYLRVVERLVPFVPRAPRLVTKEAQPEDLDSTPPQDGGEAVSGDPTEPTTAANKPMQPDRPSAGR